MTWDENNDDLVGANRDYAFPPLHAEDDDGSWVTAFTVTVPFKVNGQRLRQLIDGLKEWVEAEGLDDYIDPDQITYTAMHRSKAHLPVKENNDGEPQGA